MADRQQNQIRPQRRFTDEREGFASSIGRNVAIEGTIRGTTNLEIWGSFEGDMEIEGLVWLRPGSARRLAIRCAFASVPWFLPSAGSRTFGT